MSARETSSTWSWVVWGTAAIAYAFACIHRSSLASLGLVAQDHFGIEATTLAMFAVIQSVVYAVLQVPVGILLDRIGAARMIVIGGLFMFSGQLAMAYAPEVSFALMARVLLGAGDAATFVSVISILPRWFKLNQLPTVTQLTGLIGQSGQLVSVAPFAYLIATVGWREGFAWIAIAGLVSTVACVFILKDTPSQSSIAMQLLSTGRRVRRSTPVPDERHRAEVHPVNQRSTFKHHVRALTSNPKIRLAFWMRFTSPFAGIVFLMLWGTPFLVSGMGLDPTVASSLLSLNVVASMAGGLLLGPITSRFTKNKVWIHYALSCAICLVWAVVLIWPGRSPLWLLTVLMITIALGIPAAFIGFEVSRSAVSQGNVGIVTAVVNAAEPLGYLLAALIIGLALDALSPLGEGFGSSSIYKLAFAGQFLLFIPGLIMILVEERKARD